VLQGDITEQPKGISGSSPTQKINHEWGGKEEQSKELEKNKNSLSKHTAKWTQLKAVVKNRTTGHRNDCIPVPAELIILHGRIWVVEHIITDFSATNSWCYRFIEVQEYCDVLQEKGYHS
jgi:hypothetical protein